MVSTSLLEANKPDTEPATQTRKASSSNAVDDINVAKLKAKADADAYAQSEFDASKDKETFRQFVDSNESSRRFYM
jgi:inositol oxygenase